jgi:hypothetical protein
MVDVVLNFLQADDWTALDLQYSIDPDTDWIRSIGHPLPFGCDFF